MLEIIYYVILIIFILFAIWDLHHSIKAKKRIVTLIEHCYYLSDALSFNLYKAFLSYLESKEDITRLRGLLLEKISTDLPKDYFYYRKIFCDTYAFKRYMKDVENEIYRRKKARIS